MGGGEGGHNYGIPKAWGMTHFGYSEGKGCENVEAWNLELPDVHFEQSVRFGLLLLLNKIQDYQLCNSSVSFPLFSVNS